jgi:hypothetical protein
MNIVFQSSGKERGGSEWAAPLEMFMELRDAASWGEVCANLLKLVN